MCLSVLLTSLLTKQIYTKMKISIWCHLSYLRWLLYFGPFILGEKGCFYYKDVALQGINPTPSVCAASVLALVTPTLYTAIFSTKLLQPVLPAAWHLTPSLSHPKGCVVGSRWHSTELNVQMPAMQYSKAVQQRLECWWDTRTALRLLSILNKFCQPSLGKTNSLLKYVNAMTWLTWEFLSN